MERPEYIRRLDFDDLQYEQTVNAAVAAVKGGDRDQARRLLFKAIEMNPSDTHTWTWLSATTDDPAEQRDYLEHALAADPGNAAARRGLVLLSDKLDRSRLLDEGQGVEARRPQEPEDAHAAQVFACPNCGGRMLYKPEQGGLVCEFCGYTDDLDQEPAGSTESAEQVLDFVLPTTMGHRWAEAQHRLSCAQCGAVTLLTVGQTASECPYCGSRQLIESAETAELLDPNVIAPALFGEQDAQNRLRQWLGLGWFIPDDLRTLAKPSRLRPAYYPFWTFDGTLQMSWTCEVNEGSSDTPRWVVREGVEFDMFDDVLVPGLNKMDPGEISRIEPFRLKEMKVFDPKYLAGWQALTYDLSLADASLKAREIVTRRLRRSLPNRVMITSETRNLHSGGLSWSGMTYKLALIPLWVGTYHYRGKVYRLLVNGQTGKVGGKKPTDPIKVVAFTLAAVIALGILISLLLSLAYSAGWFSL